MSIWRMWMAGQVDASLTAAALIAIAMLGRRRLAPFVRSTLLIVALFRLALPPFVQSPWSELAADLPLVDDARYLITSGLHGDRMAVVMAIAAAISLALLGRLAWQVMSTRRHLLVTSAIAPDWLQARARSLAGRSVDVDIRVSHELDGPLAAGIRRRLIVLPSSIVQLDRAALDAVIAHELGHHERRDLIWVVTARALAAIAWFNPLAHLAARAIVSAREDGSDDWALSRTAADPFGYAHALLMSARNLVHRDGLLAAGAHPLAGRLRRLLDHSTAHDRRPGWAGALIVIAITAAGLPGAHAVQIDSESDAERVVIVIRK